MSNEKIKVLEMIQAGKLTAAEGLDLLKALDDSEFKPAEAPAGSRFLRIRVAAGQQSKVNVNIPLSLLKVATKFVGIGMNFIPEEARREMAKKGIDLADLDFDELLKLIEQGLVDGKLVDVDTEDEYSGRTKVEVYVE